MISLRNLTGRGTTKNRNNGKDKGSLTVEALLFLIPFMCAFFTLINAARFVQTEMLIHHAITQTAKQISTYSYVLTKAGIAEKMQNSNRKSREFTSSVEGAMDSIENLGAVLGEPSELVDGVFSLIKSQGSQTVLTAVVGELSENSIENSIALISDDPDEYLRSLGVVDGLSGLNFSLSQWNTAEDGKMNIDIIVTYEMENAMFPQFNFGRYEFCQCASTLTW